MTSITADDLASDDPCPSLSMNQMTDTANPSKAQQVNSYPLLFFFSSNVFSPYLCIYVVGINPCETVWCTRGNFI